MSAAKVDPYVARARAATLQMDFADQISDRLAGNLQYIGPSAEDVNKAAAEGVSDYFAEDGFTERLRDALDAALLPSAAEMEARGDFCAQCQPTHKHDKYGRCLRHGKVIQGLISRGGKNPELEPLPDVKGALALAIDNAVAAQLAIAVPALLAQIKLIVETAVSAANAKDT